MSKNASIVFTCHAGSGIDGRKGALKTVKKIKKNTRKEENKLAWKMNNFI